MEQGLLDQLFLENPLGKGCACAGLRRGRLHERDSGQERRWRQPNLRRFGKGDGSFHLDVGTGFADEAAGDGHDAAGMVADPRGNMGECAALPSGAVEAGPTEIG